MPGRSEESRTALVLDATLFYPQGGGQPADAGTIRAGAAAFAVADVRMRDGRVLHYGAFVADGDAAALQPGARVTLEVDAARRRLHARIHSAGHLLDVCMERAGWGPDRLARMHSLLPRMHAFPRMHSCPAAPRTTPAGGARSSGASRQLRSARLHRCLRRGSTRRRRRTWSTTARCRRRR